MMAPLAGARLLPDEGHLVCSMARGCRILASAVLLLLSGIVALPRVTAAMTVQEAILRAQPAAVLIISQIAADIIMDCGKGLVSVSPTPFVETGSGWFVDGRGYLVTSAHVVLPPSATLELKKTAIEEGCVDPELRARGLARGQGPDVEARIRGDVTERAMATMKVTLSPSVTVLLSNGRKLPAEVKKFSPPLRLDAKGVPLADSGRDLALLRVQDAVYSALHISTKDGQIGDAVHILGFPALIRTHELLDRSISLGASVTHGAISAFRQDAIGQDVIQTDAPATYGNSGGPAIGNDAAVVGVMTFVSLSPSTGTVVQGFNFLIPAKDVRKFLEGTGVHIGESRFNIQWADALGAFFKGDYRIAAAKLSKIDTILPDLPDVKRVLGEAQEKVKHPAPGPFPWSWVALGVTLASVGVYGGLFGRRLWSNRIRILHTQSIALIEKGLNPIMLDMRRREDFETSPLELPGVQYGKARYKRDWQEGSKGAPADRRLDRVREYRARDCSRRAVGGCPRQAWNHGGASGSHTRRSVLAGIRPDTDLDIDAMAVAQLLDMARHGLVPPERYLRNAPRGYFGS